MNFTLAKALLLDAFYQVLDNRVFRILIVAVFLCVAVTFAVGFREDEIVLFFGWKTWTYEEFTDSFGTPIAAGVDVQVGTIRLLQRAFVDNIAGSLGMTFAIAATAFFIPRLLEKGLADGLFSKPLARATFYLACYATGLVFVGLLALVLVFGMHFGLLVASGYSDPGFLWGALTLTYVFALLHAFTMLIGVWTRSSAASLLLGLLFFMVNAGIHNGWILKEWNPIRRARNEELGQAAAVAVSTSESAPTLVNEAGEPLVDNPDAGADRLLDILLTTLDTLHFTLPKTTDASVLTEMLRAQITRSAPLYLDPESGFRLQSVPEGWSFAGAGAGPAVNTVGPGGRDAVLLASLAPEGGHGHARAWIECAPRRGDSLRSLQDKLEAEVRARTAGGQVRRTRDVIRERTLFRMQWDEPVYGKSRRITLLSTREESRIFTVVLEADPDWLPGEESAGPEAGTGAEADDALRESQADALHDIAQDCSFDQDEDPLGGGNEDGWKTWYERRFGWSSPWRYNAFFSIGSSLAFTIAILGLGIWKLMRIDF